ncbi:MAG: type IV secretory system conjugative DNA transfer family protein [Defluviitaleaceae bacterium]|nr:type IV secretory system conjugative DNA transfer family protein [Defluviitaleaceae bacterium]
MDLDNVKALAKKAGIWALLGLLAIAVGGYIVRTLLSNLMVLVTEQDYSVLWNPAMFLELETYMYGAALIALCVILWLVYGKNDAKSAKRMMSSKAKGIDGALENSRFMTDSERDKQFKLYNYNELSNSTKDGVPLRAVLKGKDMKVNLSSPMHALIIGATGSGKTTTFINPMVQILGETKAGSSMILTDPKGELFMMHSQKLKENGYKVMVLDLRDPYSSYRWNPLESLYLMYQDYLKKGEGIYKRTDSVSDSGLEFHNTPESYQESWYEYQGKAYSNGKELKDIIKVSRQRVYDEMYEDLNDLVGVLCPIESEDDPVWEKGARSIIMSTLLAMLEDSENPELEMTVDKFNFFNLNKAIANSENEYAALKNYFQGRGALSKAVTLSRQVLAAADNTLSSYMSIAFDKMNIFNDEGICALTSATDINPDDFANEPTALFLKIPDEKDTRHGLAAVFVLCIYKALIKIASAREDLSLPRNVYFILDEFGNMPKIDKFDKMITVGRSRKIWFNMVVQSYAQLGNVYGDKVSDIIKSNCGIKMFIGSNDIDTCKEFSELCGNMTVSTSSVSRSTGSKEGDLSVSTQIQNRPLIYPSDLQKLNNSMDMGNSIIVTFGNYPLKTKYTPSFQCPLYKFGTMDLTEIRSNVFYSEEVYYDLEYRNSVILGSGEESAEEEGVKDEETAKSE